LPILPILPIFVMRAWMIPWQLPFLPEIEVV